MLPVQLRQTCECGLSFRYAHDFEEHKRVGCVVKSSDGPTFSDKDVEPVEELPAAVAEELIAEVVAEAAPEAAPEPKTRKKK